PLLFQHEFSPPRSDVQLRILGCDISKKAIRLARDNLARVRRSKGYVDKGRVEFMRADVFVDAFGDQTQVPPCLIGARNWYRKPPFWDILVSNPPYVSPSAFWNTTTRSVRGFEPKLALVPPAAGAGTAVEQGDEFYPRLLAFARHL